MCPCINWVAQNTKQHPFLIHAGRLYTICFFFFVFSKQHAFHSKNRDSSERTLHPISHAINVIQLNGKQLGEKGQGALVSRQKMAEQLLIYPHPTARIHQQSFRGWTACGWAFGSYKGGPTVRFLEWSHMPV